ncbi:hypothetical protein [Paenibacillus sp. N3.4]|uniref:hypothetical protein n=1 Tax=Paenibacillus sp. N3.4 TaxID=2603222 RepID=UPI0011C92354|nr:hypothetical protein [Paenibacillus sp. N3.4]TXK85132.1 hypothetical protein FU659_05140 [Paenibacillus sp. N3.4]
MKQARKDKKSWQQYTSVFDPTGHYCTSSDGKIGHTGDSNGGLEGVSVKDDINGSHYIEDNIYAKMQLTKLLLDDISNVGLYNIGKLAYTGVFNDPLSALDNNKNAINNTGATYGIPSYIIGAIIFRDQGTKSPPDNVANATTYLTGRGFSVGLGAIFATTASEAWESEGRGDELPKEQWLNVVPYYNSTMSNAVAIEKGNHYGAAITSYLEYVQFLLK